MNRREFNISLVLCLVAGLGGVPAIAAQSPQPSWKTYVQLEYNFNLQ